MEYYCWRYGVVMALYLPVIAVLIVNGRELRPSEHGLEYQNVSTAAEGKSPAMMSFFGGTGSSNVPLPKARNMSSNTSWWSGGHRRGGGDHVKKALVVASLVCGISGVALLVVAMFLFLFHFQKQRCSSPPSTSICDK